MRHIKPVKSFFHGDRYRTPADAAFPVDDRAAELLVKQGLASFVMPMAVGGDDVIAALGVITAVDPGPAKALKPSGKRA